MRHVPERRIKTGKDASVFDQGRIERQSVVGDEQIEVREQPIERVQHRGLFVEVANEILDDPELVSAKEPDADQERARARATADSRCFGIQKRDPSAILDTILAPGEFEKPAQIRRVRPVQANLPVDVIGRKILADNVVPSTGVFFFAPFRKSHRREPGRRDPPPIRQRIVEQAELVRKRRTRRALRRPDPIQRLPEPLGLARAGHQPNESSSTSRIASAGALAPGVGPTHDGQPSSQMQERIRRRVS